MTVDAIKPRNVDARIGRARGTAAVVKREVLKGRRPQQELDQAMEELRITVAEVTFERAAEDLVAEIARGHLRAETRAIIQWVHSEAAKADLAARQG